MVLSQIPTSARVAANPGSKLSTATMFGNSMGYNNALQYAQNRALMQSANNFNNYQSSTAYQRTVKDMEAAGINPTVAFGLGKGQLDSSLSSATSSVSSIAGKLGTSAISALGSMLKLLFFL